MLKKKESSKHNSMLRRLRIHSPRQPPWIVVVSLQGKPDMSNRDFLRLCRGLRERPAALGAPEQEQGTAAMENRFKGFMV